MLGTALDPGALAGLQQGYRNNWQRHSEALSDDAAPQWDVCVLTASNARQAEAFRAQILARSAQGLLPCRTQFLVSPDPKGLRPGSGGATLQVLVELARAARLSDQELPGGRRIVIIHSGGDSRRLPHCSATGKLFARVPHKLPDGRASSLFDEFLVSLSGLAGTVPEGVLVASGDVLLLFDHLQLNLARPGVIGVSMSTAPEVGTQHGVYVTAPGSRQVRAFLHKPSLARMQGEGALDDAGRVAVDTGLVWLDGASVQRLLDLAKELALPLSEGLSLNLYGDLLAPLAAHADQAAHLADASDGPITPALQAARAQVWARLRGLPLSVERLHPAAFIHFGTTRDYLSLLQQGVSLFGSCGWGRCTASWLPPAIPGARLAQADAQPAVGPVAVNAYLAALAAPASGDGAAIALLDAHIAGRLELESEPSRNGGHLDALISHLSTDRPLLRIARGTVLDQLPLRSEGAEGGGVVTRLYGVRDDPKRSLDQGGTFLNRPWAEWLAASGVSADDLWPATGRPGECTLWNARLYPLCATREDSLDAVLWLQRPESVSPEQLSRWRDAPRLSLGASYLRADVNRLVSQEAAIEDSVRVQRFLDGLERQHPAASLAPILGRQEQASRRARLVADRLECSLDPWLPLRGYRALAVATGEPSWDERAFSSLARLVRAHSPSCAKQSLEPLRDRWSTGGRELFASARAAARIDFGGGWTDTPPYSLERGGTVLNAAIALRGELPILAEVTLTKRGPEDPPLTLHSRDLEATLRPRRVGEILDYASPADPFALGKAALVFRGLVPADIAPETELADLFPDMALRLTTASSVPRGSGLGASSILGGVILGALGDLLGEEPSRHRLFEEVLCLEQMITTAGGWQDQIGGLVGGIKLITTAPGLPQDFRVEQIPLAPSLRRALGERLVLVYTGQQRLAKNILRVVTGRYMAREPEIIACLREIAELALAMRDALLAEDLDALGELLDQHWAVNKRIYPGSTNPFIDELFELCAPYWVGAKLAGAGGGGFAIGVARDADAAKGLAERLAIHRPSGDVRPWHCTVTDPLGTHVGRASQRAPFGQNTEARLA